MYARQIDASLSFSNPNMKANVCMSDRSIGQINATIFSSNPNHYASFVANLSHPLSMVESGINLGHRLFVVLII
jgi:hypothetical protein